jgi:hypothetical protein
VLLWSQVSIGKFLQESELLSFLGSIGVEVLGGSIREVDLEQERMSKSIDLDITKVISGKYPVRYRGRNFTLSYFYEERSTLDTSMFVFDNKHSQEMFETSRTYISAITNEISIDLLRKLALQYDAYIDERYDSSTVTFFRKVSIL